MVHLTYTYKKTKSTNHFYNRQLYIIIVNKLKWIIITSIFIVLFHFLIDYFALSSVAKIQIVAEPNQDSQLTLYYSMAIAGESFREKQSVKSRQLNAGNKANVTLSLKNRICRNLRIDPFVNEGAIKVYSITFLSHFGDPITLSPKQISQNFSAGSNTSIKLNKNHVEITSTGPDPQINLRNPLRFSNPIFSYILPIFLSIICALVLKNINIKDIYAIKDISQKNHLQIKTLSHWTVWEVLRHS